MATMEIQNSVVGGVNKSEHSRSNVALDGGDDPYDQ